MEKRALGRSGLKIAPLVFGGNVFGWTADEATSFQLLDAFVGSGFNCIDTADVYSRWVAGNHGGESEAIIGKWLASRGGRDKIVIATKVGMEMSPERKGLSRRHLMEAVEASLKRLQTDTIDLYQSHSDDASVPLEETLEAYHRLIGQGKVRAIGASNYSGSRLSEALRVSGSRDLPRYESLQPQYNLYDRRDFEQGAEAVCLENRVGVITYYSLASGFLTGKYRSAADSKKSPRGGGMAERLNERGLRILAALDEVSVRMQATPAQVALAWLIARPSVTAPIASATSVAQLAELMQAVHLKLDEAAVAALDAASRYQTGS
jgi:aryl-alcohol dehydrogenase-like predicted oxidoreductase